MLRAQLLKLAVPLVKTHGFTREALAHSALCLPTPHSEPLSERAVSALFGKGDEARQTLINAWLDDARARMQLAPSRVMKEVLRFRLQQNEPVLGYLPEAYAVLISPTAPGLPPIDPRPALWHAASVADEACYLTGDESRGLAWYARRASVANIYAAAELHQLTSLKTVDEFLGSLLETSSRLESAVQDVQTYATYIGRSWAGIIKSRSLL